MFSRAKYMFRWILTTQTRLFYFGLSKKKDLENAQFFHEVKIQILF
jgi:hypothetical protein